MHAAGLTPEAFNLANQPIPKGCFPPGFTNIAETAPVVSACAA